MPEYSHSRLSTYEDCPRKFAFRYVEKVETDSEGIEAFVGKRVHEILERLYHHVGRFGRPPSLRQVLERYAKAWEGEWHDRVTIVRQEISPEDYRQRGADCLENYYRAHYPFSEGESVGIEERLRLSLDPEGRYRMVGIADRIVRFDEGRYEIHDYKTGSRLPSQRQIDRERQLALYQIGLEQSYGDVAEVELVWHYLAQNRTLRSRRSSEQLEQLRRDTMELIDTIEAASEYPARTGPLCRWCDYRELCPAVREEPTATEGDGEAASRFPGDPPDEPAQLSLIE